jgi:hypothetical protein
VPHGAARKVALDVMAMAAECAWDDMRSIYSGTYPWIMDASQARACHDRVLAGDIVGYLRDALPKLSYGLLSVPWREEDDADVACWLFDHARNRSDPRFGEMPVVMTGALDAGDARMVEAAYRDSERLLSHVRMLASGWRWAASSFGMVPSIHLHIADDLSIVPFDRGIAAMMSELGRIAGLDKVLETYAQGVPVEEIGAVMEIAREDWMESEDRSALRSRYGITRMSPPSLAACAGGIRVGRGAVKKATAQRLRSCNDDGLVICLPIATASMPAARWS